MPDIWNTRICKGVVKKRRCKRYIKEGASDFCCNHLADKIYYTPLLTKCRKDTLTKLKITKPQQQQLASEILDIQIKALCDTIAKKIHEKNTNLDKTDSHTLMCIHESWNDVPLQYQIKLFNAQWDIRILLQHFAQQLNSSDMENPSPVFPSDPFTRRPLPFDDIQLLKKRVIKLNTPINLALKTFLSLKKGDIIKTYIDAQMNTSRMSCILRDLFDDSLRFKVINCKNSQDCFTGYWVYDDEDKSIFELIYEEWKNTPYQTLCPIFYMPVENPQKEYLYLVMSNFPTTEWTTETDATKEFLA